MLALKLTLNVEKNDTFRNRLLKKFICREIMVCGSLEEMPEKSWVARLQSGLAALVAFSGVLMVSFHLIKSSM